MGDEVLDFSNKETDLKRRYEELIMKNYGTQLHYSQEKFRLQKMGDIIAAIKYDIFNAYQGAVDKVTLKRECMALHHKYRDLDETPPNVPCEVLPKYTEYELLETLTSMMQKDKKVETDDVLGSKGNEDTRYRRQQERTIVILKREEEKRGTKKLGEVRRLIEESVLLTR